MPQTTLRDLNRHQAALGDAVAEDILLRAYLLRALPEAERNSVELRLFADDAFFEAACALEGDLLADYAAGELSQKEAAVVRDWLAASAEARERLGLIQALARQAG